MTGGEAVMRDPAYLRDAARVEKCVEFVRVQSQPGGRVRPGTGAVPRPVITISRQAGTAAHVVGDEVAALLEAREPKGGPWAVFDKNLVDRVLEDRAFPRAWAEFMPEDRVSEVADTIQGLFGLHPAAWTLVRKTAETMLRLADLGNVVLIGRGANVITGHLPQAFHVRLIGSLERRVVRIRTVFGYGEEEAREHVRQVDSGRARYLKKYYGKDIDDPHQYHLFINTDRLATEAVARVIADAVVEPAGDVDPAMAL
jgi:hypothetical protein